MSTDSRVRARDASTARCSAEFSVVMAIMVHRTHSRGALVSSYVPRRRASESLSYFRATRPPTSAPCRMIATGGVRTIFDRKSAKYVLFERVHASDTPKTKRQAIISSVWGVGLRNCGPGFLMKLASRPVKPPNFPAARAIRGAAPPPPGGGQRPHTQNPLP